MSVMQATRPAVKEFPAVEDIVRDVTGSRDDEEFLNMELGPGLEYYKTRLDRLMLRGERVLDAGCGAGQWSAALAQRYRQVDAIDLKESRLDVLQYLMRHLEIKNVDACRGSIDALPYEDESFDAVFCYGVIMFTPIEQVLAEFFRVLKPGGRMFVCLNSDGWSQYLIHERGPKNPAVADVGRMTLYKTYWHRAKTNGFIDYIQSRDVRRLMRRVVLCGLTPWIKIRKTHVKALARLLITSSPTGRETHELIIRNCGRALRDRFYEDAIATLQRQDIFRDFGPERAYRPDEIAELLRENGFAHYEWMPEGELVCDWQQPECRPRYDGFYKTELAVWEFQAVKPDRPATLVSPEFHVHQAQMAARQPVFCESTTSPHICNTVNAGYPPELFKYAKRLAGNSDHYIQALAAKICDDAASEDERARKIIRFVQQALYRDPVSQPLEDTGAIPDAATILYCARGRCGHAARLTADLARHAGLESRVTQLQNHVIAEICVDGRWVIADADAFKNGVIPVNRAGEILSIQDLEDDPFQIDRFPATGFFIRPNSVYSQGVRGTQIAGYVDALEPENRSFVSGFYQPLTRGFPPSLPDIVRFEFVGDDRFELEWTPSTIRHDKLRGYRVRVGTASRGWSYEPLPDDETLLNQTSDDVLSIETTETHVRGVVRRNVSRIFVAITPISARIEIEPETFFRPSEEACCER